MAEYYTTYMSKHTHTYTLAPTHIPEGWRERERGKFLVNKNLVALSLIVQITDLLSKKRPKHKRWNAEGT